MKKINSKYLCVVLVLFLMSGLISPLSRNDTSHYLAPFSFLIKTDMTLSRLVQLIPLLSHLIADETEGVTYQQFMQLKEIKEDRFYARQIDLNTKIIQMYMSLFLWSDQKWIPERIDLNDFLFVKGQDPWPEEYWATVYFKKSNRLGLKKVPERLKEKSLEMTLFVLKWVEFASAQGMKEEYFLDYLVCRFLEPDQALLLFLVGYGLRENKNDPLLQSFSDEVKEKLSLNAFYGIKRILEPHKDILDLIVETTEKNFIEMRMNSFCQIINAIPAGQSSELERLIGSYLNEYITAGRNKQLQETFFKSYTKRYDRSNFFPKSPLLNSNFDISL